MAIGLPFKIAPQWNAVEWSERAVSNDNSLIDEERNQEGKKGKEQNDGFGCPPTITLVQLTGFFEDSCELPGRGYEVN
ncbi:MAG: hypothetical protein WAW42_12135 [Candidatus Competibacteraceae bacterium]|jgi:hypothetical protein